jgi:hypothetical protein
MSEVILERRDWSSVVEAFVRFFEGLGEVRIDEDRVEFGGAPTVQTGLALRRDGTSTSFMPLHGLEARWERVRFDEAREEVVLEGSGVSYVYRVPPDLRSRVGE